MTTTGAAEAVARPDNSPAPRRPGSAHVWWPERVGQHVPTAWLVTLGLVYLAVFLYYAWVVITWPLPYDQGEGFVLHDAQRVAAGLPLYTSNEEYPFYSSNYPPGFPWLLARLSPLLDRLESGRFAVLPASPLASGRFVSVVSALVAAAAIGVIVRRVSGQTWPAVVAALLFTASPYVYGLAPLFKSDVPALALSLVALALLAGPARPEAPSGYGSAPASGRTAEPGGRTTLLTLAAALPLLLLALWTKPLTAAAAGAVILWLTLRRRALGAAFGCLFLAACLAVQWWLDRRSNGYFSVNFVSGNFSEWRWWNLIDLYARFLLVNAPLVAAGLLLAARRWHDRGLWLPLLYAVLAFGVALGVGIWGAGSSYLLHPLAAACVLAGLALATLPPLPAGGSGGSGAWPAGRGLVTLLLLAQLLLYFHLPGVGLPFNDLLHPTAGQLPDPADRHAADEVVAWLAEDGGPVYSEEGFFAMQAGLDVVGNPTTLVELESAGRWRGDALMALFEQRAFRTVVLGPHMLPERVLDAIRRNYAVLDAQSVHRIRYLIARPKPN